MSVRTQLIPILASLEAANVAACDAIGDKSQVMTHEQLGHFERSRKSKTASPLSSVTHVLRSILSHDEQRDDPVPLGIAALFAHFSTADILGSGHGHLPVPGDADPVGKELLARHPTFPQSITSRGAIAYMAEDFFDRENRKHGSPIRETASIVLPLDGSKSNMFSLPQSPAEFSSPISMQVSGFPTTAELFSWASSSMLLGFDFGNAVTGDNVFRTATDRPSIPLADVALSSEIVLCMMMVGPLWYYYADAASAGAVIRHWCSWISDRVVGARATPIDTLPWNGSSRPLYSADTDHDIASSSWSLTSRALGHLQPTDYQMSFSEFYSLMALRAALPLTSCDGVNVTDLVVVIQVAGQIPNLLYDEMSGDHRGAAFFKTAPNGRALAQRFLAAARWYTQCSPSAMGLALIPSAMYAWTSKRHGPGYWKYVRPRIIEKQSRTKSVQPTLCVQRFWYGTEFDNGFGCPAAQPCRHTVLPTYSSPFTALIDVVESITACDTYQEWRSKVDNALADLAKWLRDLATSPQGDDVMLRAVAAAASPFMDLMTSTLAVALDP
ncbi:hypothetical protein AAL_05443 [Moelleriella libera RCEF 2490]|uniref:Uncharacterized protein n=1 Tax=Moelleriella libera RCEF 2490 TaxID=1081109 RepID=A0A168ABQ2_9HYPO|nr:hypothetical protein AAL_05443 [Moelleriella libera RCEF 2490]